MSYCIICYPIFYFMAKSHMAQYKKMYHSETLRNKQIQEVAFIGIFAPITAPIILAYNIFRVIWIIWLAIWEGLLGDEE